MKLFIPAFLLCVIFSLAGCAQMFAAKTTVHVEVRPDGTCIGDYTSAKEQIGFEASVCGGSVKVDKSSTQEAVIAAVLQSQAMMAAILERLGAGAKAGALSGS